MMTTWSLKHRPKWLAIWAMMTILVTSECWADADDIYGPHPDLYNSAVQSSTPNIRSHVVNVTMPAGAVTAAWVDGNNAVTPGSTITTAALTSDIPRGAGICVRGDSLSMKDRSTNEEVPDLLIKYDSSVGTTNDVVGEQGYMYCSRFQPTFEFITRTGLSPGSYEATLTAYVLTY